MSSPGPILLSPRKRRTLIGAALVIGLGIFLIVVFDRQDVHNPAADVSRGPTAARSVARLFLETAVARKNLATGYAITGPWLKGISRAQWINGDNPVPYYPASNLKTAPLTVSSSRKNAVMFEIGPLVVPKRTKFGGLRSLSFRLEVDRVKGKWLVNYFMPEGHFEGPIGQRRA